jgi:hypothetical protein
LGSAPAARAGGAKGQGGKTGRRERAGLGNIPGGNLRADARRYASRCPERIRKPEVSTRHAECVRYSFRAKNSTAAP